MILQALVELAENEKLIADPDFEFKPVSWIVHLDRNGKVIAPIDGNRTNLNDGAFDKKGKPLPPKYVGNNMLIPLFPSRSGKKPRAAFLVDMAAYLFAKDAIAGIHRPELIAYVERFRQGVFNCETSTNDPAVTAVRRMLDRVLLNEDVTPLPKGVGKSDLFAFRFENDAEFVHQRPSVVAHWKRIRAAAPNEAKSKEKALKCLVTGLPIVGAPPLFPPIKGVPKKKGAASDLALLSFNGPPARTWFSYGLKQNENAALSRFAAEAAGKGLNRLTSVRPTDGTGAKLPVRRIKLSEDTIVVFWSPEPTPQAQSVLDLMPDLLGEQRFDAPRDPAEVGNLLAAYRTGTFTPISEPAKFYAMTLTGTTGRIIVRDWFETTVVEIQSNVAAYFRDLATMRPVEVGEVHRLQATRAPSLRDIKLAAYRELDDVPAPFGRDWLRLIWDRRAKVPPAVAQRVVNRIKIAAVQGEDVSSTAVAILQLYLAREKDTSMKAYLNEDHPSPAYHSGRMLAVLDFAQQRALKNTNTTNVRRMLGAIMTAPALYLARVRKLTEVAYLPKCSGKWPKYLQSRIQAIGSAMRDEFPSLLSAAEQSTFFLGMDHERSYLDSHPAEKYRVQAVNGLWVQSAGEANVVKALLKLGHPFEYEPGIKLVGDAYRVPDFMISAPDVSQRVFIEYLGMRDQADYEKRWQSKLAEFTAFGLKPIDEGGGPNGKLIAIDYDGRDYAGILALLERHLGRASAEPVEEIEALEGSEQ